MILVLSVNRGKNCTPRHRSTWANSETGIAPPEDGDEITREEYEVMVEEKLEELRTSRGRGRIRRIG